MPDLIIPSRQDFIDAIEAGIKAAGDKFSQDRIERLRHHAQTATSFACGTWRIASNSNNVSCPLDAIGASPVDPGAKEFTKAYDEMMFEITGYTGKWVGMQPQGDRHIFGSQRGMLPDAEIGGSVATPR